MVKKKMTKKSMHSRTRQRDIEILMKLGYTRRNAKIVLSENEDSRGVIQKDKWLKICRGAQ